MLLILNTSNLTLTLTMKDYRNSVVSKINKFKSHVTAGGVTGLIKDAQNMEIDNLVSQRHETVLASSGSISFSTVFPVCWLSGGHVR